MKLYSYYLAVTIIGFSVTGCATPQGQPDNTATGALVGGAVGAVIGSMARDPGAGAAVGATVGALTGGAVGHGIDQEQQMQQAQLQAQTLSSPQQIEEIQPLTIEDIKSMVKSKIGDDIIISQIQSSQTVYRLKTADILDLKRAYVSERVIDYMINTPNIVRLQQAETVSRNPPSPLVEQVVVAPGPDYFWINGVWIWLNGGWTWRHGYWRGGPHGYGYGHHEFERRW